jgi:hypothetical protein
MSKTIETVDDSIATSKVTITITGAFFNDDKSVAFVKTDWLCEGKQISVGDLIHIIESGKVDILKYNQKNNPLLAE